MICASKTSGYIDPEPIIPKPPELDTADASFQSEHQIIPAWINGNLIENNSVIRFIIVVLLNQKYGFQQTSCPILVSYL
jgi:hypothetical protein